MGILYTMKAENVKKIRKRLKLTQAGLAKLLGCRSNTVYRWEAGLHPPSLGMAMLMRLALANRTVGKTEG